MNELQAHRVAERLRAAAGEIELAPGSIGDVIATGRRRTRRRRQAGALALVAAVGGGTALTVQRLTSSEDTIVEIDAPTDPTAPDEPVVVAPDPTSPPAPLGTPDAAGAVAIEGATPADAVPASAVESNVVWRVVEPNSTEAVGLVEGGGVNAVSEVPGLFLSTAPGRSNDFRWQFWRTEDGVSWSTVPVDLPFGNPYNVRSGGGVVYQVGTAPGIARSDPNPLLVAASADEGATWDQIELPVDTHDGAALPFVQSTGVTAQIFPDEAGALVVVGQFPSADYRALMIAAGVEPRDAFVFEVRSDGVVLPADRSCVPEDFSSAEVVPLGDPPPSGRALDADGVPTEIGGCAVEIVPWAELDVPPASVEVFVRRGVRAFRLRDGSIGELEVPAGVVGFGPDLGGLAFFTDDGRRFVLDEGDRIVEDGSTGSDQVGWEIGRNASTSFRLVDIGTSSPSYTAPTAQAYGAVAFDGGDASWADWSGLFGADRIRQDHISGVTNLGLVIAGATWVDPVVEAGGREVSVDGYTLWRSDSFGPFEVVEDATGRVIDPADLGMTGPGILVIGDGEGGELARIELRDPELASIVWGEGVPDAGGKQWFVATSADAVHVAVESLAELLGVDDANIRMVNRISTDGATTVLAVSLQETHPDGSYRQLVLIGTPAG